MIYNNALSSTRSESDAIMSRKRLATVFKFSGRMISHSEESDVRVMQVLALGLVLLQPCILVAFAAQFGKDMLTSLK